MIIQKKFITEDEILFKAAEDIIEYAEKLLSVELDDYIYQSLTDHISFALKRNKENIDIKNDLLYEIKRIHKKEFEVGKWALEYLNKKIDATFPIDEAGFIAMHIVNANYKKSTSESILMTKIVKEILSIIKYYYLVEFEEEDFNYERLITHLKFFAKRLIKKELAENEGNEIINLIKLQYKKAYDCACEIKTFIESNYEYEVTEDELLYLTLHVSRVTS